LCFERFAIGLVPYDNDGEATPKQDRIWFRAIANILTS